MKKVWIVVASSSQAKIYRADGGHTLVEHAILFHDESLLPAHELVSDRAGRGRESNTQKFGSDTYDPKTSPKMKESQQFAEIISDILERGFNAKSFEKVYIVAKAPFLGFLRSAITPHVAKLVETEIHKDLTQLRPDQIREYLPHIL